MAITAALMFTVRERHKSCCSIIQLLLPGTEMMFIARLFHSCPFWAFSTFQKACYLQDTNFVVKVNL